MAEKESFIDFRKLTDIAEEDEKNLTRAKNTQVAYKKDWVDFENFCKKYQVDSLPANYETVRNYLVYLSKGIKQDYKLNTIKRRIASISVIHKIKGYYKSQWRNISEVADIDNDGILELLVSRGESKEQTLTLYKAIVNKENKYFIFRGLIINKVKYIKKIN